MNSSTARWNVLATCTFTLLLSVSVLVAQTPSGSISGVVKDESGAVIPGATVVVTNVGTGVKRSVSTDSGGRYRAPGLDPGSYELEGRAAGFQTELRKGIQLLIRALNR